MDARYIFASLTSVHFIQTTQILFADIRVEKSSWKYSIGNDNNPAEEFVYIRVFHDRYFRSFHSRTGKRSAAYRAFDLHRDQLTFRFHPSTNDDDDCVVETIMQSNVTMEKY